MPSPGLSKPEQLRQDSLFESFVRRPTRRSAIPREIFINSRWHVGCFLSDARHREIDFLRSESSEICAIGRHFGQQAKNLDKPVASLGIVTPPGRTPNAFNLAPRVRSTKGASRKAD
jgi:hypothetical protein